MHKNSIDAYLVRMTPDINWLMSIPGVFDQEPAHLAIVFSERAILHTDERYSGSIEKGLLGASGELFWTIDTTRVSHYEFAAKVLASARTTRRAASSTTPNAAPSTTQSTTSGAKKLKVAFQAEIPHLEYLKLQEQLEKHGVSAELINESATISKSRIVKDKNEIKNIKHAQELADETFSYIVEFMRPGIKEREVQANLDFFMRKLGSSGGFGVAFPTIIASGPNSALPHAMAGERMLKKGDFVIMDFGACYNDYCSDMTRTVVIGKPSAKQQEIYDTVLAAFNEAKRKIRPGMTGKEADGIARKIIEAAGYGEFFTHGLGHGVGIEVHELPSLSKSYDLELPSGSVITIEPGIYIPDFGGVRIEDCGVLREDGFESFTTSTTELLSISK
jgi:Xaa-Pro aminopeptidase